MFPAGLDWSMRALSLLALAVLFAPPAAAQATEVPCALAEHIDLETYALLRGAGGSEVDQDEAAFQYAECLAAGLKRDLGAMPQLSARLASLRKLYRQLNAADGELASAMMGGGTMYTHAIPRSYPTIETTLRTLSALAGSRYGAQTGGRYTASIQESRRAFAARVTLLPDVSAGGRLVATASVQRIRTYSSSTGDPDPAATYTARIAGCVLRTTDPDTRLTSSLVGWGDADLPLG